MQEWRKAPLRQFYKQIAKSARFEDKTSNRALWVSPAKSVNFGRVLPNAVIWYRLMATIHAPKGERMKTT